VTIRVAIPVKLARLRVWVEKGRRWSAVDRLVLWSLSETPRTARSLAEIAGLPHRLVNEMIVRMMHFGWIELVATPTGAAFQATAVGAQAISEFDDLPRVTRQSGRRISFLIEPFTCSALGSRGVTLYNSRELREIARDYDVRRIAVDGNWSLLTSELLHEAAREAVAEAASDEELLNIDFNASTTIDRSMIATVVEQEITGLPASAPRSLIAAVRRAAEATERGTTLQARPAARPSSRTTAPVAIPMPNPNDILLSGSEHRQLLVEVLGNARYHVVLHSTFLNANSFIELQEAFRTAARRGAEIDIFWGANAGEASRARNLAEAIEINKLIQADLDLRPRARVHMSSTRSHAKLLIADMGIESVSLAIVGSCNWLSSWFNRIETSVVVRHPLVVANVAQCFADLIFSAIPTSEVAGRLNRIARELRLAPATGGEAQMTLVMGDRHGVLLRRARDGARKGILAGADRLGAAAEARAIIPMIAAAARDVSCILCYSRTSGPLRPADAKLVRRDAQAAGVILEQIPDRALHGKFLLWDRDDLVITSLNWSSADTSRDAPTGEVGLYLHSPGIAATVRARLAQQFPTLAAGT
jgi:cardiolipin synthase A/B